MSFPFCCSQIFTPVQAHTYELQESNVNLKLTLVDTVGYGDQINKEDSFKSIVDYIDNQFEVYLQEELKIKRNLATYVMIHELVVLSSNFYLHF